MTTIVKWLLVLMLKYLLPKVTPDIRRALVTSIENLQKWAATTPNPWDDRLAEFLNGLLIADKKAS